VSPKTTKAHSSACDPGLPNIRDYKRTVCVLNLYPSRG
jgi:hypothetical protein